MRIKVKVKLATLVEGNPKAPFSQATTLGCRGGNTPFPGLLHFIIDPYFIMLVLNKVASSTIFWVFGMTRPGIEPLASRTIGKLFTHQANKNINMKVQSMRFPNL